MICEYSVMLNIKSLSLGAFLTFTIAGQAFAAAPKGPQLIGEYRDWVAYFYDDSQGRVCYMASTPKKDEGKYTKRGDIYVVVTHRPAEQSYDVVNFVAGYDYKPGAKVQVKIGTNTINDIFTEGDKAWGVNERTDKELVEAMKKGQRMIVHGVSSRGTETKDTYSLNGFMSAYRAINAKCGRK